MEIHKGTGTDCKEQDRDGGVLCVMGSLPTHSKSTKLISMRKVTATLCVTIAVLLGSAGNSQIADY